VAAERGGAAAGERHEHLVLRARERRGLPQRVGEDAHDVAHLHPRGGVVTRALEAVDGGPHGPLPEALTLLGIQEIERAAQRRAARFERMLRWPD
jgi:hypothetical protein